MAPSEPKPLTSPSAPSTAAVLGAPSSAEVHPPASSTETPAITTLSPTQTSTPNPVPPPVDDSSDDEDDDVGGGESKAAPLPPPADPDAPAKLSAITGLLGGAGAYQQALAAAATAAANVTADKGEQKKRERASKLEFRRLDELYNKNIHDFYLAESSGQSAQKEDKWEEYIFIVRRRFDWQNKYQKTFVDIKSKDLKEVLSEVLDGITGISLVEDKPTLEPNLLFNYLPQLERCLTKLKADETSNERATKHLELLINYINNDYAETKERLFPLLENQEITFDLLWALFLPNSFLYTTCPGSGEDRCLQLDWAELKETMDRGRFFQLDCHYVDYDGKLFGEANCVLEVPEFRGTRKIDNLGVYPLEYHAKEAEMRQKLIERGKKFCELKGMHYRMYKGIAFFKRKKAFVKVNVNGRIMADPSTFRRINPNYRMPGVKEFSTGRGAGGGGSVGPGGGHGRAAQEDDSEDDDGGCCDDQDDDDDDGENINSAAPPAPRSGKARDGGANTKLGKLTVVMTGAARRKMYTLDASGRLQLVPVSHESATVVEPSKAPTKEEKEGDDENKDKKQDTEKSKDAAGRETMTERELLLCSPTILGFSFADKLWLELAVEHVQDIVWNTMAFDSLVLPEAQKSIVRALVESHTSQDRTKETGFDDVIKGKGKGLVAVLHGRPGVGKTLTAEGISEYLKRPLYMVGAGELGTDARTLEAQLGKILDVAHVWNAVLLLDEADVFLERRSVHDLQRNALVSIFLRLLEYFQGILFLTTNRVETFDEAFQSRIHIALRYNDLDRKAKKQIWTTFLSIVAKEEAGRDPMLPSAEGDPPLREVVTKEELEFLSRRELNGRQIKNAVRTAQALASNEGKKLGMKQLRTVLDVMEGFEKDLKGGGQADSMMSYA